MAAEVNVNVKSEVMTRATKNKTNITVPSRRNALITNVISIIANPSKVKTKLYMTNATNNTSGRIDSPPNTAMNKLVTGYSKMKASTLDVTRPMLVSFLL